MKNLLGWGKMLGLLLLAIILGETIKPFKDLEQLIKLHEPLLLASTIGMAVLGFVILMGSILGMIMNQGEPMSHREVEDSSRRMRDQAAWPYTWRASAYRIWGKTAGRQAHDEFSFHAMKEAWRTGAWWRTSQWRRRFVTTAGGLMIFFGIFGLIFVVAPISIKLFVGGTVLYALARTALGFWHA